jgi:hypothetical protein
MKSVSHSYLCLVTPPIAMAVEQEVMVLHKNLLLKLIL